MTVTQTKIAKMKKVMTKETKTVVTIITSRMKTPMIMIKTRMITLILLLPYLHLSLQSTTSHTLTTI